MSEAFLLPWVLSLLHPCNLEQVHSSQLAVVQIPVERPEPWL